MFPCFQNLILIFSSLAIQRCKSNDFLVDVFKMFSYFKKMMKFLFVLIAVSAASAVICEEPEPVRDSRTN